MKKIRILSLDGGGIRGIIPATIIQYIEKKLQEISGNPNARIADYFDFISGTSTGGILTCFYLTPNTGSGDGQPTTKFSATDALEFYSKKGYDIFNKSKYNTWFGLRTLFDATAYSPKILEGIFKDTFGDLKMSELVKPCLVTTYDIESKTSFFFTSREPANKKREFFVRDVTRSTSAAPTYFPPAKVHNLVTGAEMVNLDGGVFANNPTMCTYAECRDYNFEQNPYPTAKDMLILSIGTGGGSFSLPNVQNSGKWGVVSWAKSIPDIMMDGSLDAVDFQMKKIYETLEEQHQFNYKRINVPENLRNYSPDMANASPQNIKDLITAGKATLEETLKPKEKELGLDQFIQQLFENAPEAAVEA